MVTDYLESEFKKMVVLSLKNVRNAIVCSKGEGQEEPGNSVKLKSGEQLWTFSL